VEPLNSIYPHTYKFGNGRLNEAAELTANPQVPGGQPALRQQAVVASPPVAEVLPITPSSVVNTPAVRSLGPLPEQSFLTRATRVVRNACSFTGDTSPRYATDSRELGMLYDPLDLDQLHVAKTFISGIAPPILVGHQPGSPIARQLPTEDGTMVSVVDLHDYHPRDLQGAPIAKGLIKLRDVVAKVQKKPIPPLAYGSEGNLWTFITATTHG
jgi:hypothetical protein